MLAHADAEAACRAKLDDLKARASAFYPRTLEVAWGELEPCLKTIKGLKAFEFDEVNPEPAPDDWLLSACLGDLLLVSVDGSYFLTIGVRRQRQISEVKVFGYPGEAWRVSADLVAINLYHVDSGTMVLFFRLRGRSAGRKILY